MLKSTLVALSLVFFSYSSFAETKEKEVIPATILIKKDKNGVLYVYRSSKPIGPIQRGDARFLSKLKFEKLSDVGVISLGKKPSKTEELDKDLPRQSWYMYWGYGYGYGYYPMYYPMYYQGYAYNYTYYPYYYYNYNNCYYAWYGYGGGGYNPGYPQPY